MPYFRQRSFAQKPLRGYYTMGILKIPGGKGRCLWLWQGNVADLFPVIYFLRDM